jgi:hypothetical protein
VVVVPGVHYSHLPPNTFPRLIKQFYRNGRLAAFCNKFYPQWVFETPGTHVRDFVERRSFAYRAARYLLNMAVKAFSGHFIYLAASFSYAAGYMWGYIRYRHEKRA